MTDKDPNRTSVDAVRTDGKAFAEIKFEVDAVRTVRSAVLKLAFAFGHYPDAHAYLVLVDPTVTGRRLDAEWRRLHAVLRTDILDRITICVHKDNGQLRGIPRDPPADIVVWLSDVIEREEADVLPHSGRTDFEFVVLKVLIHEWLLRRAPVTVAWLVRTVGCSYPTVARILKGLGSVVRRESDRSVSLAYFPHEDFSRLLARSEKARSTIRYADRSGRPRAPEAHLRRLEKLKVAGLAIGGVLGARHHCPSLDLAGTPRLDLSMHCHWSRLDVGFIEELDPALQRESDPRKPANVVVHAVRHADSLFVPRSGGLPWADPVECLFDLHEARLTAQASQYLHALETRPGMSHER